MKKAKTPRKLLPFDAARYLTDEAAIAEYMTAALEANEPDLLLLALGDIARARGWLKSPKKRAWGGRAYTKRLPLGPNLASTLYSKSRGRWA